MDVVSVSKGDGLPLGSKKVGHRQWQFSIAVNRARKLVLHLFHKGENAPFYSITYDKTYSVGGIFSVLLTFSKEEEVEYVYEVDGKIKLDPYAKQLRGREKFGEPRTRKQEELVHCVAVENAKPMGEPLYLPFHEMILYRLHVRGFTQHESSKVKARGTFRGIEEKIGYLKRLGINSIMLMPCYEFDETIREEDRDIIGFRYAKQTVDKETGSRIAYPMVNFWGYTEKANYFAPKTSYAMDKKHPIEEFSRMVNKLHENGIQVIMEIYFAYRTNYTLILDCLRYWVRTFGIDGFKINNEVVLGKMVVTDPYLARTKFLATTWNLGDIYNRYEIVEERTLAEYNDGFMVDARRFLKSDEGQTETFMQRFRRNEPQQSVINYVSTNNGFTLLDMVSYDMKHNEANGENGADGTDYNYSWNCGWEGPTKKKQILQLRLKQIKNVLLMLFLSQGVPMLMAGDEFGNTQLGNNNAYCQDNEIGWVDWKLQIMNQRILKFTKNLIALRKEHPVFAAPKGLRGTDYIACGCPDISFHGTKPWYPELYNYSRVLGVMLYGKYAPISKRESDKSFYIAYNMHWDDHKFDLPKLPKGKKWKVIMDTDRVNLFKEDSKSKRKTKDKKIENLDSYLVKARSVVVFQEMEQDRI